MPAIIRYPIRALAMLAALCLAICALPFVILWGVLLNFPELLQWLAFDILEPCIAWLYCYGRGVKRRTPEEWEAIAAKEFDWMQG